MLSAVLAAAATALLVRTGGQGRLVRALPPSSSRAGPRARWRDPAWWTTPWPVGVLAGLLVWWFLGGWAGAVAGPVVGVVAGVWVGRLETSATRRRRERVQRDLPLVVDLVVSGLLAGRPTTAALRAAAGAVGGPLADDLARPCGRIELGADPAEVWSGLAADPVLAPLGRALGRAHRTGASMVDVLEHLADDLRRDRRGHEQRRARSVGVRTAAPLGLCFLPAFALVAIVPAVAALLGDTVATLLGP